MTVFRWLLRRELWEHRNIYVLPIVLATLLLVLYSLGLLSHGPGGMVQVQADSGIVSLQEFLDEEPHAERAVKIAAGALPFLIPTILLNVVMILLWFFYLTDTLYSERKDRSVLFWKSLPVSDTKTVLSKLVTAMVIIPAIVFVVVLVFAIAMSLTNSFYMLSIDKSPVEFVWTQLPIFSGPVALAYALIVQSLWYAPVFGWLLLASAWAQRGPALWAVLPLAGVALLESSVYHSNYFLIFLGQRLRPVVPTAFRDEELGPILDDVHYDTGAIAWPEIIGRIINAKSFVADPQLWGGLVVAGIFVATAIWLRRYRDTN